MKYLPAEKEEKYFLWLKWIIHKYNFFMILLCSLVSHPHTIPLNASDKYVVLGISVEYYALLALPTHILFVYSFWVLLLLSYLKFIAFIWVSGWLRFFYLFFSTSIHAPNSIETWSDMANIINHNCHIIPGITDLLLLLRRTFNTISASIRFILYRQDNLNVYKWLTKRR